MRTTAAASSITASAVSKVSDPPFLCPHRSNFRHDTQWGYNNRTRQPFGHLLRVTRRFC